MEIAHGAGEPGRMVQGELATVVVGAHVDRSRAALSGRAAEESR